MYACVLCVCICVQKLYVQWILYVIVRAADTSYASVSLSCHNLLGYTNPMCVCVHVYYIPFVFILVWRIMQLVWIRNNDNRSIEVRASATWMEWMILAPIHQSTLFVLFECVVCVCVCVCSMWSNVEKRLWTYKCNNETDSTRQITIFALN